MVAFQENIICGRLLQEIHDQISKNNMGEVKIEFQENNNGLRFFAQTVVPYGDIFLCVSFQNDRFPVILK